MGELPSYTAPYLGPVPVGVKDLVVTTLYNDGLERIKKRFIYASRGRAKPDDVQELNEVIDRRFPGDRFSTFRTNYKLLSPPYDFLFRDWMSASTDVVGEEYLEVSGKIGPREMLVPGQVAYEELLKEANEPTGVRVANKFVHVGPREFKLADGIKLSPSGEHMEVTELYDYLVSVPVHFPDERMSSIFSAFTSYSTASVLARALTAVSGGEVAVNVGTLPAYRMVVAHTESLEQANDYKVQPLTMGIPAMTKLAFFMLKLANNPDNQRWESMFRPFGQGETFNNLSEGRVARY